MRSAQVLSRLRGASQNQTERNPSPNEDTFSLNSWSECNSNINLNRSRSAESEQYQSLSPSSPNSPYCFLGDKNDIFKRKTNDRRSSNEDHSRNGLVCKQNSSSKSREQGVGTNVDFVQMANNYEPLSPTSDFNPLSFDFKSASFNYTPLWEGTSTVPSSSISSGNQQFVIKKADRKPRSQSLKPMDISTPPSIISAQRLYPNLDELRISSLDECNSHDKTLYPKLPTEDHSPPKSRSNFPTEKDAYTHRAKASLISSPSSRLKKKRSSDFGIQSAVLRDFMQPSSSQEPMYFKSNPVITTQRSGVHPLRSNNSSNDLESMNKQILEHRLEPDNMKSKMMSFWNNIKYGWTFKSKSTMKSDSPLYLLGTVYHKRCDENEEPKFLLDFASRIWLTYRSNFYPIPGSKLTTDCGWGCMLRSGQMLLAQCFLTHFLGRDWRLSDHQSETQLLYYREILRWFSDPIEAPSDKAPFCLHHLVTIGRHYKKVPGEWYGPASAAYIFRDSLNKGNMSIPLLKDLCIYVAQDCTVFIDDINQLCRTRPKSDSGNDSFSHVNSQPASGATTHTDKQDNSDSQTTPWCRSLIIFIPVRLGGESMNEIYMPCIKSLLSYSKCTGIIGGKPKHSLYFIGWQDDKLIYLDPHYCREAVDTSFKDFNNESFHCNIPRMLSMTKMDPSCTIGFYIKDETEFKKFVHDVTEFVSPPKQKGLYPLFIFSNGSQEDAELAQEQFGTELGRVKVKHYVIDHNGQRRRTLTRESEEFIML